MKRLSTLILVLAALLSAPACAGIRFHGQVGLTPVVNLTVPLRSNSRQFVDLTSALAFVDDSKNTTAAMGTGGATAMLWNDKPLAAGASSLVVRRLLLDNFTAQAPTCTNGASLGRLAITGFTSANTPASANVDFVCDTTAPTTWAFGANTPAQFGGYPIQTYLPGTPSDWTLAAVDQTVSGQFVVRTGTDFVGNAVARVVLAGTAPTFAPTTPTKPITAGGSSTMILRNSVLGQTFTLTYNFIAGQFDIAPWSTDNGTDTQAGSELAIYWCHGRIKVAGEVLMLEDGQYSKNTDAAGKGSWLCQGSGFAGTFPTTGQPTSPYAGGSWDYQGWMGPNGTLPDPGWITMRSRNFAGASIPNFKLDIKNFPHTTNPALGLRFSNVKSTDPLGTFGVVDSNSATTVPFSLVMIDHTVQANVISMNLVTPMQSAFFVIGNDLLSPLSLTGKDVQTMANLFENVRLYNPGTENQSIITGSMSGTTLTVTDVSAATRPLTVGVSNDLTGTVLYAPGLGGVANGTHLLNQISIVAPSTVSGGTGTYTLEGPVTYASGPIITYTNGLAGAGRDMKDWANKNITPGSGHARSAFNSYIGGQAIATLHVDTVQYQGASWATSAGENIDVEIQYGNLQFPSTPWLYTSTDLVGFTSPSYVGTHAFQGQSDFNGDLGVTGTIKKSSVGNLTVSIGQHGIDIKSIGAGSIIKNNMLFYNAGELVPNPGAAVPWVKFDTDGSGNGGGLSVVVTNNLMSTGGIINAVNPVTDVGNAWSLTTTWQTDNLINPTIGTAGKYASDIWRAYAPKAVPLDPQALTKGPYFDSTKIDPLRHTVDPVWLFAPN